MPYFLRISLSLLQFRWVSVYFSCPGAVQKFSAGLAYFFFLTYLPSFLKRNYFIRLSKQWQSNQAGKLSWAKKMPKKTLLSHSQILLLKIFPDSSSSSILTALIRNKSLSDRQFDLFVYFSQIHMTKSSKGQLFRENKISVCF